MRLGGILSGKALGPLLALFFLLTVLPSLWAQGARIPEGPVTVESDSLTYDEDQDTYRAVGNVMVTFAGGYMKADSVAMNRKTNEAFAEGNVYLKSERDVIEGESLSFNIVTKTGVVHDGKMFIAASHFYVKGETIEKTGESSYRLKNAQVTNCDGDIPDWSLAGRDLELTVDGYGTLKNGRFLAHDVPVFYVPYLVFPAKTTRQSGLLLPRFNFSRDKNGMDVEVPYFWAISEDSDATFYQRYLEKRGLKEGVEYRYFTSPKSFGTFYADFLNDGKHVTETVGVAGTAGSISRDWQENQKRWSYYLNTEKTFDSGLYIRSDIRKVSDPWYFRDFSAYNYYLDNYSRTGTNPFQRVPFVGDETLGSLDSTVRMVKTWPLYSLTGLVRYTDDFTLPTNDATLQKYPEITLTGFRRPLPGTPLQFDFTAVYDNFYRGEGQKGHLLETNPTFYMPMKLGRYIQATPQAGIRGSVWSRSDSVTDAGDRTGDREVIQTSALFATELSRIFSVGGPAGAIDKIRHAIRPELTYTYIPEAPQDKIPDFLAVIPAQHTLTYAMTNTLISRTRGKDGKNSYDQMMRLKLAQTFDVKESRRSVAEGAADNRPLSDVTVELDMTPFRNVVLKARNLYSVNAGYWTQTNYDLSVYDARGDLAVAGYRYTRDTLEEVNLYLKAAVTSSLSGILVLRRNLKDNTNVETTYGLRYLKQCWLFELNVSSKANDLNIGFNLSLLGLGGGERAGGTAPPLLPPTPIR